MPVARSLFLTLATALATTLAPAIPTQAPPAPPPATLPNIVILYADDMGYGDLHANNPESKIPTPHLDRLATDGMRFTDAHSSSGVCTPSRYALLTGRAHWRQFHGIVDSFGPSVLPKDRLTLPELLRDRGYRTACIGKWHLGWDWQAIRRPDRTGNGAEAFDWTRPIPDGPLAHGFDHYFGDDVPNFPPYAWIEDDRVVTPPTEPYAPDPKPPEGAHEGRPGPMVAGWRLDAVMPELTRRAVAWIGAQKGSARPFFLYFPFTSPHAPIVPTEEFRGRSEAGPYGDFVLQTDATVGAVLAALDEHGLAANTLVIFSSDNGPEHYAFERVRKTGHRSMGQLRGVKRDVWEGGHRVPFVVRWPGVVQGGAVSNALLCQTDVMATLAAVVGADLPRDAAEDGFDQLPVWRGEAAAVRTFAVHNTSARRWAVREGDHVLIEDPTGSETRVPEWFAAAEGWAAEPAPALLFDLRRDPGQRRNRLHEEPERVAALRALLARLRDQGWSAPRLGPR